MLIPVGMYAVQVVGKNGSPAAFQTDDEPVEHVGPDLPRPYALFHQLQRGRCGILRIYFYVNVLTRHFLSPSACHDGESCAIRRRSVRPALACHPLPVAAVILPHECGAPVAHVPAYAHPCCQSAQASALAMLRVGSCLRALVAQGELGR